MEGSYCLETENRAGAEFLEGPFYSEENLAEASLLLEHQAKVERVCKSKPEVSCRQMVQLDVCVCVSKHTLLEGMEVGG